MRRREFITLIGGAAASLPRVVRAQQGGVGLLMSASESDKGYQSLLATFRDELGRLGWVEDRNIRLDYRWGAVDAQSRQRSAKELITLQPDLLLAQSTPTAATLVQQTSTIPIIFFSVGDPVGEGFVASLSRPGRNATGFINMEDSMSGKWLDLLREIAPHVRSVAILFNPATAPGGGSYYLKPFNAAAAALWLMAERWSPEPAMVRRATGSSPTDRQIPRTDTGTPSFHFFCHLYARARRARRRRGALADGRTMVAGAGDGAASYGVIANRSPNSAH